MKNSNIKKILFITLIFVIIFINFASVYAELNGTYSTKATAAVTEGTVNTNVKNSFMLQAIGALVYFVGNVIVWILSMLSMWILGTDVFPWADMIIYNAIPFLDINFIKPNASSLIFEMSDVIRNIYFSVLSISIAFFSISVLIMAIRLVTTSISSQKAKYKQAITNWLMGIVMLFTIHYFIAFIFYLNENLVLMASSIAKDKIESFSLESQNLDDAIDNIKEKLKNNDSDEAQALLNLFETEKGKQFLTQFISYGQRTYNLDNSNNLFTLFQFPSSSIGGFMSGFDGLVEYLSKDQGTVNALGNMIMKLGQYRDNSKYSNIAWLREIGNSLDIARKEMPKDIKVYSDNRSDEDYISWYVCEDSVIKDEYPQYYQKCIDGYLHKSIYLKYFKLNEEKLPAEEFGTTDKIGQLRITDPSLESSIFAIRTNLLDVINLKYADMFCNIVDIYRSVYGLNTEYNQGNEDDSTATGQTPIGVLAEFFRTSALSVDTGKLVATKISFENSVMYTIFVAQSLMYFFSYMKRFFYVIILSLMAPIVVVYDFLKKTTS